MSQFSNDEQEKSWYHYQDEALLSPDLIERLKRDENAETEDEALLDKDEEEDIENLAWCQLEPAVKDILKESWIKLQKRIESMGMVTFLSLFNAQPDTLDTYLSPQDVQALQDLNKDKL